MFDIVHCLRCIWYARRFGNWLYCRLQLTKLVCIISENVWDQTKDFSNARPLWSSGKHNGPKIGRFWVQPRPLQLDNLSRVDGSRTNSRIVVHIKYTSGAGQWIVKNIVFLYSSFMYETTAMVTEF